MNNEIQVQAAFCKHPDTVDFVCEFLYVSRCGTRRAVAKVQKNILNPQRRIIRRCESSLIKIKSSMVKAHSEEPP
jgi:hypothetical protein